LRQNVLTRCAGLTSLSAMAIHHIAVNLLDRVPTAVAEPEKRKSRSKRLLMLFGIGTLAEIKDEDLQRFKRQYGLWI
jgi:hypothetical protein